MTLDWSDHYARADTPWDLGRAHPELVARLARGELEPPFARAAALVPGCGRGHDALALAEAGWRVVAIDFVEELEGALGPALARLGSQLVVADALQWRSELAFELLFDHTFFCALEPARRAEFGALVRAQLTAGARLCSIVFPADKPADAGGPPYGFGALELECAIGPAFRRTVDEPVGHAVSSRSYSERWVEFQRDVPAGRSN